MGQRPAAPRLGRLAGIAGPILVGLAGAWLAILVAGRADYAVGPFRVELFARPGPGFTEVALPPFGRVRADTHVSPLRLTASLREVAAGDLTEIVREQGFSGLVLDVEQEAFSALRAYTWRTMALAVGGAVAAGLLVYRLRWRPLLAAGLAAGLFLTGAVGLTRLTYRPEAFLRPTFTGSLALAPRLVGPIREATGRIQDFRAELARLVGGAVQAYTRIAAIPPASGSEVAVLHISDIHLSPLGMDFAQRLAESFEVDLVLDTGDLTSFGSALEQGITGRIAGFGVPYVFVRGNHDSSLTTEQVSRQPGAVVLDGEVREVAGLLIYGAPHPVFTPHRSRTYSDEELAEEVRAVGPAIAADIEALPRPPDLLAVHDDRMAEAAAGRVPVVVSGHFHRTGSRLVDGSLFLRIGTTGAGGLDTFTAPEPIPLAAEILYFDGDPLRLVAWDVVMLDPITQELTVRRQLAPGPAEGETEREEPAPLGEPVPIP